jgi:hypothetical protein
MRELKKENVTKILFLDIDGPLIPARLYFNGSPRPHSTGGGWAYDPVAVGMIATLVERHGIQLVYNSSHNDSGKDYIYHQALNNQLADWLHVDFMTTFPHQTYERAEGITKWLQEHMEVTHWASVDDFPLQLPNAVQVDYNAGMTLSTFEHLERFLKG